MATPKEVKLFGAAMSGYCTMVHYALRLKGVAYDYVEVDLKNKSEEFLKLHPVHKKVPVLVVDGKPIPESLVILQYVDDTWKEPPFLPQDPYLRSKVRFWADFFYQKIVPVTYSIRLTEGEAQNKAVEEFLGLFKTLEDGINKDVHVHGSFIHGEEPGLLDVILGACRIGLQHFEQRFAGMKPGLLDKKFDDLVLRFAKVLGAKETSPNFFKVLLVTVRHQMQLAPQKSTTLQTKPFLDY